MKLKPLLTSCIRCKMFQGTTYPIILSIDAKWKAGVKCTSMFTSSLHASSSALSLALRYLRSASLKPLVNSNSTISTPCLFEFANSVALVSTGFLKRKVPWGSRNWPLLENGMQNNLRVFWSWQGFGVTATRNNVWQKTRNISNLWFLITAGHSHPLRGHSSP